jgi:hypothetical protein
MKEMALTPTETGEKASTFKTLGVDSYRQRWRSRG